MTTINNIYFPDTSFTLKEIQDILKHKKKKFSIRITDALKDKREGELVGQKNSNNQH